MTETDDANSKQYAPLSGIKILEYGVFHAGPAANAILGDLGAEIIKVESISGDPMRSWVGVAGYEFALKNGEGLLFHAANRNKKSICLDIKQEKGRQIFDRLVMEADVFLTNLRKSTKVRMGLDYPTISGLNEKIIYASVSGYGTEGPFSDLGAYDPLGSAISGLMLASGNPEPQLLHMGILDQTAAITISHGIITALLDRERRGVGQEVHASLYSSALWIQYINLLVAGMIGKDPCIPGDRTQHSPLRNRFKCKDAKWIYSAHHPENKYWETFCLATGQDVLFRDSRYTDPDGNPVNFPALTEIFDEVFCTKDADEWMKIFAPLGLLFMSVQSIMEVAEDPQALANDFIVPFQYPVQGNVRIPNYPIRFSQGKAGTQTAAPRLGEHTDSILQKLGFSRDEIEKLREEKIIK